jgi:hypothetical protein
MAASQVFNVLTEFRFDAGHAIASSGALTNAVDKISSAAEGAMFQMQRMSIGIVSNFLSGPGGGVLGVLGTAVKVSEDYLKIQVALANSLGRGSGSFASRMDFIDKKMGDINKKAKEFGIPAGALAGITKTLTPMLVPKMGAGKAVDTSIDLGRSFLKAAPSLGMDPFMAQDNLQRAVLGTINAGDQLFMTLTQDTDAMKQFIGNADKFRKLPLAERVKTLSKALDQFSGDASVVERMFNSVGGQIQVMKDNLSGLGSILKPIGDVISNLIVKVLKIINNVIDKNMRFIGENLALAIEPFTRDLGGLVALVMQFSKTSESLKKSGFILFAIGVVQLLSHFKLIAPVLGVVGKGFGIMGSVLRYIGTGIVTLVTYLGGWWAVINGLVVVVSSVMVPFLALMALFEFFGRVAAHVKIAFAETILGFTDRIADLGLLFMRIFAIFEIGFNTLAKFAAVSPVMDALFWIFDKLLVVLEMVVTGVALAISTFQGLVFAIAEFIEQVKSLVTGGGFDKGAISGAYNAGIDSMLAELFPKIQAKIDSGEGLVNQTVNQTITMKNDFKEMLEPDRVAFTISEQLLKAARNGTGSRNNGFAKPGA